MEGFLFIAMIFMSITAFIWIAATKSGILAAPTTANDEDGEVDRADEAEELPNAHIDDEDDDDEEEQTRAEPEADQPSSSSSSSVAKVAISKNNQSRKSRMSRRQKKNVRKKEKEPCNPSLLPGSTFCTALADPSATGPRAHKKRIGIPSPIYVTLGLRDDEIFSQLLQLVISPHILRTAGFPMESQLVPGKAWVYQDADFRAGGKPSCEDASVVTLDVNAREFVPNFARDKKPAPALPTSPPSSSSLSVTAKEFVPQSQPLESRTCARCNATYRVFQQTGEYVSLEKCVYHWGKRSPSGSKAVRGKKYSCCGKTTQGGCVTAAGHVWRGPLYDLSGHHRNLEGFLKTRPPSQRAQPADGNFGVYGLDGEMVYTTAGLELVKVTVVGVDGRLVYEMLVRPDDPIVDYNTRFSGVSAKDLKRGPAKGLKDVQNDLLGFINANTILIGHSLENDLRALKLIHMTVIDTSLVFPHYYGLPYRHSLKSLVQAYLHRKIQVENSGHDSYEDARACVELTLWKVHDILLAAEQPAAAYCCPPNAAISQPQRFHFPQR